MVEDFDKIRAEITRLKKKKGKSKIQRIEKVLSKKVEARRVFKKAQQITVELPKERNQIEPVPIYFKKEIEDVKKQLFSS